MEKRTGEVESTGTLPGRATTPRAKLRRQSQRDRPCWRPLWPRSFPGPYFDMSSSVFPVKLACRVLVYFRGCVAEVGCQGGGMGLSLMNPFMFVIIAYHIAMTCLSLN